MRRVSDVGGKRVARNVEKYIHNDVTFTSF